MGGLGLWALPLTGSFQGRIGLAAECDLASCSAFWLSLGQMLCEYNAVANLPALLGTPGQQVRPPDLGP